MTKSFRPDKFPGVIEKIEITDRHVARIEVPSRFAEGLRQAKERGGIYMFICYPLKSPEQIAEAMESDVIGPGISMQQDSAIPNPQSEMPAISVETLSAALECTEKTIQNYADLGMIVRTARGQYDLLSSLAAMNKARKDAETAQGDELRKERKLITREKRISAELDNLERSHKLGNCEECIKVRILKNANIKQRILSLEKTLPQKTGGRTAEEQVLIIRNETRKLLTDLAATERPVGRDSGSGPDISAAPRPDGKRLGGRGKKARRKN